MTTLPGEAVKAMPERIYAKVHGASTDLISGQRGLIGGWNEHKRDGQAEYVRADLAILSALEPSAARELALEALRSAEQFIENGFEFGFIRKPDEGDTALETLPKIKAAIRDLQSNAADARPLALEEGFRKGLEAACDVIDAHNEYDRRMCCDGRECGCYGATVHQSMQHYIRALSSPDHADAGKVEGDGWHVEYEVYSEDEWQAASTDLDGALDYAVMYAADGFKNITVQEVRRRTLPSALASEGTE